MNIEKVNVEHRYKKVIFLDVDGVLNSTKYFEKNNELGLYREELGIEYEVDRNTVKLLRQALDETGAEVVLSSSWRYSQYADLLQKLLLEYNIKTDKTPYLDNERGTEIKEYLKTHKEILDYIILDDDIFEDYDDELLKHLIWIIEGEEVRRGLQKQDIEEIIRRFGPIKRKDEENFER